MTRKEKKAQQKELEKILQLPKMKKHRFMKVLTLLSFFVATTSAYKALTEEPILPYDDTQPIPPLVDDENQTGDDYETRLAKEAYNHLLSILYTKSANLGVVLEEGYKLQMVSYEPMDDTITVILKNSNENAILKFSAQNIDSYTLVTETQDMADQISILTTILDAPLVEAPVITTLSPELNTSITQNVASGISYYANTPQQFSDGDIRDTSDELLIAGRDYYYFNVFGTAKKDGLDYNVIVQVSLRRDDFEIAGIEDIISYYLQDPNNEKFVINVMYQEREETLDILNQEQTNDKQQIE